MSAALAVTCPTCNAGSGYPCHLYSRVTRGLEPTDPHQARIDAAGGTPESAASGATLHFILKAGLDSAISYRDDGGDNVIEVAASERPSSIHGTRETVVSITRHDAPRLVIEVDGKAVAIVDAAGFVRSPAPPFTPPSAPSGEVARYLKLQGVTGPTAPPPVDWSPLPHPYEDDRYGTCEAVVMLGDGEDGTCGLESIHPCHTEGE